jgi:exodeoxyribonuclease-3
MPTFLAWNLRHGGGGRGMPHIVLSLLEHAPDVILLSEFRSSTGGQIAGVLADHGWRHQHASEAPPGCNGLLIASRHPLRAVRTDPGAILGSQSLVPAAAFRRYAEVEIPALGLALANVHIPCDGKGLGRDAVFQILLEAARRRKGEAFVILGDLNAGRHHLDEGGDTFTCTRCLGQLAAIGYVDAFRRLHPEAREYTWYSHEGAGFRIDHAYVSAALAGRIRACTYSHRERTRKISDHSALLLTLVPHASEVRENGAVLSGFHAANSARAGAPA